jgi:4-alpha-glucanotransferase
MQRRASGLLLHIISLPSEYGIGDLGTEAYHFVEFLATAKQRYWQMLPLNPTANRYCHSPYSGTSAFAGNPLVISPEMLYRQGFLTRDEISNSPTFPQGRVDYTLTAPFKSKIIDLAFDRFKNSTIKSGYLQFCSKHKNWLDDYATFVALQRKYGGRSWCCWPAELRDRRKGILELAKSELKDVIDREKFIQYMFFEQWSSLKEHCNRLGVNLIGDIPLYVGHDSADVWANQDIFKLGSDKSPRVVAGIPPDYYSREGQVWDTPVYDWRVLKNAGYLWWIERLRHCLDIFDFVRLDHFQGFVSYWQIPASDKRASSGRWANGPGEDFLKQLLAAFPFERVIADDLGNINSEVKHLIERFKLTCIRVLQFAFDGACATNPHYPRNHVENCVVYTGTHDNNTTKSWFEDEISSGQKKVLLDHFECKLRESEVHWELIRLAMGSVAKLAVFPLQDILGLDEGARMNQPGTANGNWQWRLQPKYISAVTTEQLIKLTEISGRAE